MKASRPSPRRGSRLVLMAIAASGMLAGTSLLAQAGPPVQETFGRVMLDQPLAGASILILDESRAIHTPGLTGSHGNFAFTLRGKILSPRFRVLVSGGTLGGVSFQDTLRLDVDGYVAGQPLYVNAVTTMISLYRDRHPPTSVAAATGAVKGFLAIPATTSVGFGVSNPRNVFFSHGKLLAAVVPSGGGAGFSNRDVTSYLHRLVDEMDRGVAAHAFKPEHQLGGNVLADWAKELAKSVGEATGEEIFGYIFDKILTGLGLNEEVNLLNEINAKLDELKKEIDELKTESKEIEKLILDAQLTVIEGRLETNFEILSHFGSCAKDGKCPTSTTVFGTVKSILEYNSDLKTLSLLIADGEDEGLLVRAHDLLKQVKRFYPGRPYAELETLFEHYQALQLAQATLLVEAYHAQPDKSDPTKIDPDPVTARIFEKAVADAVEAQTKVFGKLHGKDRIIVDQHTKRQWSEVAVPAAPCVADGSCVWDGSWVDRLAQDGHCRPEDFGDYPCGLLRSAAQACRAYWRQPGDPWRLPSAPEMDGLLRGTGANRLDWLEKSGFGGIVRKGRNVAHSKKGDLATNRAVYLTDQQYPKQPPASFFLGVSESGTDYWGVLDIDSCYGHFYSNEDCWTHFPGYVGALCVSDDLAE